MPITSIGFRLRDGLGSLDAGKLLDMTLGSSGCIVSSFSCFCFCNAHVILHPTGLLRKQSRQFHINLSGCYHVSMKLPRVKLRLTRRDWAMVCLGAVVTLIVCGAGILVHRMQTPLAPASATITIPWAPDTVKHWHTQIEAMAKRYNVDPNVLAIIMTMESGGYAKANSGEAQGLMQITPLTAKDIASKYLKTPVKSYNIWDPNTNIEFGAAYLAKLRDIFGSYTQGPTWDHTVELIAAGYNGGPGAANSLEKGEGLTDVQTVVYSRDAFNMWRERKAKDSPTFDRWKERGGQTLLDQAKASQQ